MYEFDYLLEPYFQKKAFIGALAKGLGTMAKSPGVMGSVARGIGTGAKSMGTMAKSPGALGQVTRGIGNVGKGLWNFGKGTMGMEASQGASRLGRMANTAGQHYSTASGLYDTAKSLYGNSAAGSNTNPSLTAGPFSVGGGSKTGEEQLKKQSSAGAAPTWEKIVTPLSYASMLGGSLIPTDKPWQKALHYGAEGAGLLGLGATTANSMRRGEDLRNNAIDLAALGAFGLTTGLRAKDDLYGHHA